MFERLFKLLTWYDTNYRVFPHWYVDKKPEVENVQPRGSVATAAGPSKAAGNMLANLRYITVLVRLVAS